VHDADHTQCHPTSRSSSHQVPDLCNYPWSSAPGRILMQQSLSLSAMPRLPPIHHKISKCDSPHEQRIKIKQSKYLGFEFKHRQVNDSSQSNQETNHLISQSSPWWVYWQQKAQSLKFKYKIPWSIARRPKVNKSSKRPSRRRKSRETNKRHKNRLTKETSKEKLKQTQNEQEKLKLKNSPLKSTLSNTLNASSPPYIDIIVFFSQPPG
jgi:hypothetical protein